MDDREMRRMLQENLELARENNRILRKLRRDAVIGRILQIIWWAAIIGVPVFLYFTVFQPYLSELSSAYQGIQAEFQGLQQLPSGLQELFNGFGSGGEAE